MSWFSQLLGFDESPQTIRDHLVVEGTTLVSRVNGRRLGCGHLSLPSVAELRQRASIRPGSPTLREEVADVRLLHAAPHNAGAVFQVASQFNLLEMAAPRLTPEHGVTIYAHDRTQGPACALATVGGTLYRNWFVPVDGQVGQSATRQLNALAGVGLLLGDERLYTMRNGYALFDPAYDGVLQERLEQLDSHELQGALQVGWHEDVEVTGVDHSVSQVYGSALPLAYMNHPGDGVRQLARDILFASYEAAVRLASENAARTGNERLFLTLLGGGVFGNERTWILRAITEALALPGLGPLDVVIVSHGRSQPDVRALVEAAR